MNGAAPAIEVLAETGSTNDDARQRLRDGRADPFWVRAEAQTAGRGRRGRDWASAGGAVFLSGGFRLAVSPNEAATLAFAAALAVAEAVDACKPASPPLLKWPNDVLIDAAKVAGILLESEENEQGGCDLVVGIGVNVAARPQVPGRRVTCLADVGVTAAPHDLAVAIAAGFEAWLARWRSEGFAPVREAWIARAYGMGQPVSLERASQAITGVMTGLGADGALLIETDGGPIDIVAGDVRFAGLDAAEA